MEANRFNSRNSGTRQIEELYSDARYQAESFQSVLYEYTRFHMAQELLPELQSQLDEQNQKVDKLRQEVKRAEEQKNPNYEQKRECAALQHNYIVERVPVDELARCVIVLKSVKPPEFPDWLSGFLGEVVSENGRK